MRPAAPALVVVAVAAAAWTAQAADPAVAERQYGLARRLAAEGSPRAAEALRKVVELAPDGPLADDAIVDEALLVDLPLWIEDLGRLSDDTVERARSLLGRVADGMPGADRAAEATYRRALLRLEPQAGYDPIAARVDLLAVAANADAGPWAPAARVALGHLAAANGDAGRARDAWYRVVVDAPDGPAASRAAAGLGTIALRAGRPDDAAHWFETAGGAAGEVAAAQRGIELAIRRLLDENRLGQPPSSSTLVDRVRGVGVVAVALDGGLALFDRREGAVLRLAPGGAEIDRVAMEDVTALAFDPDGGLVAAAGEHVWRLPAGGGPILVGGQGEFAPAAALAAGPLGVVWLLDRRGERVGRLEPGQPGPADLWSERGTRLAGLAWDGQRLVAGEPRGDRVLAIGAGGAAPLGAALVRIGPIAADPSGRVAAVDGKAGVTVLFDADGLELGRLDHVSVGVERPTAIGFDGAGRLHVWEEGTSRWVVLR